MGPNVELGKFLAKQFPDLPTVYYIAPQQWVWAFSDQDTQQITQISDQMVAVFPEEANYYRRFGATVHYFGHPLVDQFVQPPRSRHGSPATGHPPSRDGDHPPPRLTATGNCPGDAADLGGG